MDDELEKLKTLENNESLASLEEQYRSKRVLNLAVRYVLAITTTASIIVAFITPERFGLVIAVVLALGLHLIFSEADHYKYKKKVKYAQAIYDLDRIHTETLSDTQRQLVRKMMEW